MIPVDILILWIEDLVLYIAMPTSVMSSGSAATSTPKYMQNCDTYLEAPKKKFFKKKNEKNHPQKKRSLDNLKFVFRAICVFWKRC